MHCTTHAPTHAAAPLGGGAGQRAQLAPHWSVLAAREAGVAAVLAMRAGEPGARAAFEALADHPDAHVRATGARAGRPLAAFLRDPSPEVRWAAVRAATAVGAALVASAANLVPFVGNGLGIREWAVALAAPVLGGEVERGRGEAQVGTQVGHHLGRRRHAQLHLYPGHRR